MTPTPTLPPTHDDPTGHVWADLIRDPAARTAWRSAFGDGYQCAAEYLRHFTNPHLAARWAEVIPWHAPLAAYLHAHGRAPDALTVHPAVNTAEAELDYRTDNPSHLTEEEITRAGLMLIHPHLTMQDRDAIATAGLTLTEVDHLITTGTYDRDTLATLSGLR